MSQSSSSCRIAIVTGAAQGIGQDIALRLADDGLDVAINDLASKRDQLQEVASAIEAKGRRYIVVPGDISKEDDVQAIIAEVVHKLGGLDVMVANAGIAIMHPFLKMSTEEFDRVVGINLRGTMFCYKYAAIQMVKQGRGGRILGASSMAGKRAFPLACAYSASKFAIRGMTQSVALELAEHNITVNAYAPGYIQTPLTTANFVIDEESKKVLKVPGDMRMGQPADVASLVSYLAKPEAHFITGQTISVDGGALVD